MPQTVAARAANRKWVIGAFFNALFFNVGFIIMIDTT